MLRSHLRQYMAEAVEPAWFKAMTEKEQKQYLQDHPGSKLNPTFHPPSQPIRHPTDHPKVLSALQPNSPQRVSASYKVRSLGQQFEDYYHDLPQAQRMDVKQLADRVVSNRPLNPKQLGRLAHALNKYQAWAKGLDEKKVGYGVLKGAGALGAIGLAMSPVGSVGLALGSLLLASYAVKKGMPFALKAMRHMTEPVRPRRSPRPERSTRPAATPTNPNSTALPPRAPRQELILPGPGPRLGDHLAALASYFHDGVWEETALSNAVKHEPREYLDDMERTDAPDFSVLFKKLAEVARSAHLTPEQWKPLLAYTRRRF